MTPRRLTIAVALIAGCNSPGVLVAEHEPGTPVRVSRVATAGTYGLFVAGDADPQLRYPLAVGDRFGFDHAATTLPSGELQVDWLYAVAGPYRRRLDFTQTYQWRRLEGK